MVKKRFKFCAKTCAACLTLFDAALYSTAQTSSKKITVETIYIYILIYRLHFRFNNLPNVEGVWRADKKMTVAIS